MNRVGQVFYREQCHMVILVINSVEFNGNWMHEFVSLTDLEELPGPDLKGRVYSWSEEAVASIRSTKGWRQL